MLGGGRGVEFLYHDYDTGVISRHVRRLDQANSIASLTASRLCTFSVSDFYCSDLEFSLLPQFVTTPLGLICHASTITLGDGVLLIGTTGPALVDDPYGLLSHDRHASPYSATR